MSLTELFSSSSGVSSGVVTEALMSGQYRVTFQGRQALAVSQAGVLAPGSQVTVAETPAGLVIISAGSPTASELPEVTISG